MSRHLPQPTPLPLPCREGRKCSPPPPCASARAISASTSAEVKTSSDRIRHADLDAYLLYHGGSVSGRGAAPRADETIKVVGLRRKIAENMQEAKRRIPHFTLVEEFDVTALEDTRAMMNRDRGDNPKLTVLPFLITAMGKALAGLADAQRHLRRRCGGAYPPRRDHSRHGDADPGRADGPRDPRRPDQVRVAAGARNPPPRRRGADRQGNARGAFGLDRSPCPASARWAASPRPR